MIKRERRGKFKVKEILRRFKKGRYVFPMVTLLVLESLSFWSFLGSGKTSGKTYSKTSEKDDITVIANIPFWAEPLKGVLKPTWSEVEKALPILKEVGVNTIFLWGPWERAPHMNNITVYTDKGEVQQKLIYALHGKDYLKPDSGRGSDDEFLHLIKTAHSLGMKVIAQFQITISIPGDFIYEKHPDWILKSIYGKPAAMWPWAIAGFGYIVNKANSDLINYVTEVIIPHWVKNWGVDGIFLDSPAMAYCDLYIKDMCQKVNVGKGFECLTPVDGYYSPEPLVKAMRAKIEQMEKEVGRDLIFTGEEFFKTWRDMPDELITKLGEGKSNLYAFRLDPRVDRSLGKYFDWIHGYNFRLTLKDVYNGGRVSYSENYVKFLEMECDLEAKSAETTKFVNMFIGIVNFADLFTSEVAGCYITLAATAPGKILWIGAYQLPPQSDVSEKFLGWDSNVLREWYKKVISIKRKYPALQSKNIEDALLSPKVQKLIAYNRWFNHDSVTIIVNAGKDAVVATVKTRFQEEVTLIDLLSKEKVQGNPVNLKIKMPPHSVRILAMGE